MNVSVLTRSFNFYIAFFSFSISSFERDPLSPSYSSSSWFSYHDLIKYKLTKIKHMQQRICQTYAFHMLWWARFHTTWQHILFWFVQNILDPSSKSQEMPFIFEHIITDGMKNMKISNLQKSLRSQKVQTPPPQFLQCPRHPS